MTMTLDQAAKVLGISVNATEKEIKRAYHKMCMRWHPDRNPNNQNEANKKMQVINSACKTMYANLIVRNQNPNNAQKPHSGKPNSNTQQNTRTQSNSNQNTRSQHSNRQSTQSQRTTNSTHNNSNTHADVLTRLQMALRYFEQTKTDYMHAQQRTKDAYEKYSKANSAACKERYGSAEYKAKRTVSDKMYNLYTQAIKHERASFEKMHKSEQNVYQRKQDLIRQQSRSQTQR